MPDRCSHQDASELPITHRPIRRIVVRIEGMVQGVGFRPYVYRLATRLGLPGWVCNSSQGVVIEVEGSEEILTQFLDALEKEPPPRARIERRDVHYKATVGYQSFEVRESRDSGGKSAIVMPDIATCPDCLREISDPTNRRFRYPFTNCTNCGPRYSIIRSLPYDRPNTTMNIFPMCDACRAEYENPTNRRFHAQPNACTECGPHLELWDGSGDIIAVRNDALLAACDAVASGKILALKGLGGFQLIVDARNEETVRRLRHRKNREQKPLALMYPNISAVKAHCDVSGFEEELLTSHRAPIVLLRRRNPANQFGIAPSVAPHNPYLGVMLPYTPFHHLIMIELGFPIVATSGNRSDEPICIDEREAIGRLGGIADIFLVHNRPIARQMDDSVVCLVHEKETVLRNARGYAPTPFSLTASVPPAFAVGAHLKNAIAVADDRRAFLSQHVGDLETSLARTAMKNVTESLSGLYEISAGVVARDLHPDYASSRFAEDLGRQTIGIQHHYAHALSCMIDNDIETPFLAVIWDGTGLGTDGTIWGGEFLAVDDRSFSRIAHMRQFRLPGGEAAIREPRRAALGVLWELFGEKYVALSDFIAQTAFDKNEISVINRMLCNGINCPVTSSAGRLFDAVASIFGICQINAFEGQAAMWLGFSAEYGVTEESYPFELDNSHDADVVDWAKIIQGILADIKSGVDKEYIAAKFHNSLVGIIVGIVRKTGMQRVALTGGCFQNRYLTERAIITLQRAGFEPYWHHRIPPNDGGIAAGQIAGVSRSRQRSD